MAPGFSRVLAERYRKKWGKPQNGYGKLQKSQRGLVDLKENESKKESKNRQKRKKEKRKKLNLA